MEFWSLPKKILMPVETPRSPLEGLELPEVVAPSLENFSVTIPKPPAPTAENITARYAELLRERSPHRTRKYGETIGAGDDVQVDVIGYSNGALIPFSLRAGVWVRVEPDPQLPGFAEALLGQTVGSSVVIPIQLPVDHQVAALRKAQARFMVDIKSATEVKALDPQSPEALATLGLGKTLDETFKYITAIVVDEQSNALVSQVQQRVLDELASRTQVTVPERLLDEEIRRQWAAHEEPLVNARNFAPDERAESLKGWLSDPRTRDSLRRRLTLSFALRAIRLRDNVELTHEFLLAVVQQAAGLGGVGLEQALAGLKKDRTVWASIEQNAWHLRMVEHVMRHAEVHFMA